MGPLPSKRAQIVSLEDTKLASRHCVPNGKLPTRIVPVAARMHRGLREQHRRTVSHRLGLCLSLDESSDRLERTIQLPSQFVAHPELIETEEARTQVRATVQATLAADGPAGVKRWIASTSGAL